MKRTMFIVLILALLLSTALVSAQDEDITLRWRTRSSDPAAIGVYTGASESIDEGWDGVSLVYEAASSETENYQDVLITELETGTAPDVFWIPGADIARFAQTGLILNLNDIVAADENYDGEAFYPGPMSFLTTQVAGEEGDAIWGLPRDVSAFAIYYNADLFDEAGLDHPESGWTWDEFGEAAEAISDLGDDITGFGTDAWWGPMGYWVNAAGSGFFNEDATACALDNDATAEGLQFYADLIANGAAVTWGEGSEPPYLAGQLGMMMSGRWATPSVLSGADFNWNVAPLPVGPSGEATNWLFWGAYVVNANTEHPEEAWDLVTRLTSTEIQGSIAALGSNIPSRAGDDAIELFLNTLPDTDINNQAFIDGTTAADVRTEAPMFFGNWPVIRDAYVSQAGEVFNGNLSAEEYAATICDTVSAEFMGMDG